MIKASCQSPAALCFFPDLPDPLLDLVERVGGESGTHLHDVGQVDGVRRVGQHGAGRAMAGEQEGNGRRVKKMNVGEAQKTRQN